MKLYWMVAAVVIILGWCVFGVARLFKRLPIKVFAFGVAIAASGVVVLIAAYKLNYTY